MDFADLEMRIEWTLQILREMLAFPPTVVFLMKQITKSLFSRFASRSGFTLDRLVTTFVVC